MKRRFPYRKGNLGQMLEDRLPDRPEGRCWLFAGPTSGQGYGKLYARNRSYLPAHRVAYEHFVGPIPAGKLIRHSCDTPRCCNPAHLSIGDESLNALDSVKRNRHAQARKTHCWKGHPFDEANTYYPPRGGQRNCRACKKKSNAAA
jgi:hypothetical protein